MILPGATIAVLGGGQLGRMLALAARPLGYRLRVLDPDPDCAARPVVEETITAAFDDADAAARLARGADVVTLEIEKIAVSSLDAAARLAPLRPGRSVLEMVQDRIRQKEWLARQGLPLGAWRAARDPQGLALALAELGPGCFVKAARGGYDGRGQGMASPEDEAHALWQALGAAPCVVERALPLAMELSVLVARRPSGELVVYPVAENHHEQRILAWSVLPARVEPALAARAQELGRAIAEAMALEGLLVVELFVCEDGALLVNELAPRPHNSYHASDVACLTSQFEQGVRAVCDLPLGSPELVRPAAIYNLLGDAWRGAAAPDFAAALAIPGVRLSLYGKRGARPGRKMGHLLASGASADQAVASVSAAYASLRS